MQLRINSIETSLSHVPEGFHKITGTIISSELRDNGSHRIVLNNASSEDIREISGKLRFTIRTELPSKPLEPGDKVQFNAVIEAPGGPIVPNGYDFSRKAFFDGISGSGYSVSSLTLISASDTNRGIQTLRHNIAGRLQEKMPGDAGALASALSVGIRGSISKETRSALRDAGLAHLLAISGLHMGLVTGVAFLVLEVFFAAFPIIALKYRPKKLAAIGAFICALSYLMISGMSVATVRAFIMVSIAMIAVLLDRKLLSLRSIAIAALVILVLWPESILSIGFQMSFAATTALVCAYEFTSSRRRIKFKQQSQNPDEFAPGLTYQKPNKVAEYFLITLKTTIIAQIAIAPFAIYHFGTLSVVGSMANLFVMPLVTFAIIPIGMLALLLMPTGMDIVLYPVLEWCLTQVIDIAVYFQDAPLGTIAVSQISNSAIILVTAGLALLLIWRHMIAKAITLSALLIAVLITSRSPMYPMMISTTGYTVAYKSNDNTIYLAGGRAASFQTESWKRYWGIPLRSIAINIERNCDATGCITKLENGKTIARISAAGDLTGICANATMVILPRRLAKYCQNNLIVHIEDLEKNGPIAFSFDELLLHGPSTIFWSGTIQKHTPWHNHYHGRKQQKKG